MTINNNENIKEIFSEIITEVDENSLKSYVKSLNNYLTNNYEDIKDMGFTFRKFTELKSFRKLQLVKVEKYLLEKANQLNLMEVKIKTAEKDYNILLEKNKTKKFRVRKYYKINK